jgi:L-lactate dehydrogenase complex protein LldG
MTASERTGILAAIARTRHGAAADREAAVDRRFANRPSGPRLALVADAMKDGASLADVFAAAAIRSGASVVRAASAAEVPETLRALWRDTGLEGPIVHADDPLCAACDDFAPSHTGAAVGEDRVGISRAIAAIAETGSLILASSAGTPTTVNFLPETHVVLVAEADIRESLEDLWPELRAKGEWPRTLNQITGPSRTGDIELTLQIGVHGPRALLIVVYGDGR